MLCIWWDMKGVIYFELLDINQTITANVYSQQLQRLNEALFQKRPVLANQKVVILLHDNGRPHVAKLTQQKIEQLALGRWMHFITRKTDVGPTGPTCK
jgi:hypothetical protein